MFAIRVPGKKQLCFTVRPEFNLLGFDVMTVDRCESHIALYQPNNGQLFLNANLFFQVLCP